MSRTLPTVVALLVFSCALLAQSADQPMLISRVALNQTQVVFTYAGKIWTVPRNGGAAKRLTISSNDETNPIFSPDGSRIAFSRSNGNDWDIFIAGSDGSNEMRATMMPEDDFVTSWTPDGKELIFETTRDEESVVRLYRTSAERLTLATALPLPQGFLGWTSPDGLRIAYNPRGGAGDWRYYRGGNSSPLWIADLKTGSLDKVTNGQQNDRAPIWSGDKIYFLSDRTGIFNLFAYDTSSKKTRQLTNYNDQGVRVASVFGDTAAYVQAGRIHLFNLNPHGADQLVNFTLAPDTSELLPRNAPAARSLEQFLPTPKGDRVVLGARGEVIIFNPSDNSAVNLTNTSGVAERYPTVSPDNRMVAYFSDESGEYALHVRSLENQSVKKIAIEPKPSFYWGLTWSPDSKKLVFNDRRLGFWIADPSSGAFTKVDTSDYAGQDNWSSSFSPDSRFVAYAKRLRNRVSTIFIYDIASGKSVQITDGVTHSALPAFDANGRYLYFTSSMNAGTTDFPWGVLNGVLANPLIMSRVHALLLSKDEPLPLLGNGQPNPDAKAGQPLAQVKIDLDNLQNRFINVPLPPRDYRVLAPGKPGTLVFTFGGPYVAPGDINSRPSSSLYSFDMTKGGQMTKILDEVDSVDVSAAGGKILYRKGRDLFLTSTDAAAAPPAGKLDLSKIEVKVVPADEWRQMFHESVRIMRDWFYDTNYHGRNLQALEREFAQYLPTITRRNDLNRLMQTMLSQVSVSHLGVGGGDAVPSSSGGNRVGLLGADFEIADGKYRFKKIYHSLPYSAAGGSFSAPLDGPGVDVREGDYLLQVNGQPVDAAKNLLTYFQNIVFQPTRITVSATADGANSRTYTVFPANGENRLRRANWAEENRKLVDKLSGGKLGYVFIEGYNPDGIMNAIRGLSGYADRQGVIVDQRFNSGGVTPDYLIEWMQRRPLYYYMFRGGQDIATPVNPAPPVKVMIINELNGSAAETSALMFKLGKVGPIVGKRTYGGGIGPYFFTPMLIDGGRVQLPGRAAYDPSGSGWGIENVGVVPDHDVDITPADVIAGRDPQLLKAIEVAMDQIRRSSATSPKRPVFPVHPGEQNTSQTGNVLLSAIPKVGSAFPAPQPKVEPPRAPVVTNGKFAAFVGKYDTGEMGVVEVRQEGEKLFIVAPNASPMELVPEVSGDKFMATPVGAPVGFERDGSGKIVGISVMVGPGREVKGKKTQ